MVSNDTETFTAPSWRKAKAMALERLTPISTTRALYHWDTRQREFAEIEGRNGKRFAVFARVNIVPSVGELGLAP